MINTTEPVPQLGMYLALGRAALKAREAAREAEARRQAEERRAQVLQEWQRLMERIEASIPSEFLSYVVEPERGPRDGLNTGAVRGLAYDLAPLGLGMMVAFLTNATEEGVLWIPPFVAETDTGEKYLVNSTEVHGVTLKRDGMSFFEALAVCADRAEEVRAHNEWITSPKPVQDAPADAPGDFLPAKGGGFWPVLRVGTDRTEVHAMGALDVEAFGNDFGALGWEDDMALHTFTLKDVPGFGELYAYLALVRVHPRMWRKLAGTQEV